jgi:hypothetical protein
MFLLRLGNGQHSAVGKRQFTTTVSPRTLPDSPGNLESSNFQNSPSWNLFFLLVPLDDAIERYSSKHRRVHRKLGPLVGEPN